MKKITSITASLLMVAAFTITVNSCDKEDTFNSNTNTGTDTTANSGTGTDTNTSAVPEVYMAGQVGTFAVFWKDGVLHKLTDGETGGGYGAYANSVYVSGNDIYVVGWDDNASTRSTRTAILWKNGVAQKLSDEPTYAYASANSVYVSGNDVYVAGSDDYGAILWKNGVAQRLPGGGSAPSVFVSGNDVYVAGSGWDASGNSVAIVWKNGVAQTLSSGAYSYANSVFVSGEDVYVAGRKSGEGAILWKNGVAQTISSKADSYANSVFVSGKDVYVAVTIKDERAILWTNGVTQTLDMDVVSSLFVSGKDVYITGWEFSPPYSYFLWKNGEVQDLGNSCEVNSVFVK
jgi:hypothetical protein